MATTVNAQNAIKTVKHAMEEPRTIASAAIKAILFSTTFVSTKKTINSRIKIQKTKIDPKGGDFDEYVAVHYT